jgi:hypothetical protein
VIAADEVLSRMWYADWPRAELLRDRGEAAAKLMPFSPAKDIAGSDKAAQIASAVLAANENRDDRNDGSVLFNGQADLARRLAAPKCCDGKGRRCALLHPPEVTLNTIRLHHSRRFRRPYFVSIAVFGLVGALGDRDKVSHAFQPDGRSCPSNSPYAFRFM